MNGNMISGDRSRFSSFETATYSKDMLYALKSIAERQRQHRLAELLEAAAAEAERLAQDSVCTDKSGE